MRTVRQQVQGIDAMKFTIKELKDKLENVVWDREGGFDPREDRERYIRLLEMIIKEKDEEIELLHCRLDVIDEQAEIKYLMEAR